MDERTLVVYVEDPGAANFALPLLPALNEDGWCVRFYAHGGAAAYVRRFGVEPLTFPVDEDSEDFLRAQSPAALIVGTSENPETPAFDLVAAARRLAIASFAMVDGPANVGARFRGRGNDPFAHAPDALFLPDSWTADQYAAMGFDRDRLLVSGHPYYESIAREWGGRYGREKTALRSRLLPPAAQDKTVVVFLSERSDGLGGVCYERTSEYTLHGWGQSDKRTCIVLEEFLEGARQLGDSAFKVLRLHPQDDQVTYAPYLEHFDAVSSGGDVLEYLCACDLVVGMTTSLLTEAAMMGVPTASILPYEKEATDNYAVREGATPHAVTREGVADLFKAFGAGNLIAPVAVAAQADSAVQRVINYLNHQQTARSQAS